MAGDAPAASSMAGDAPAASSMTRCALVPLIPNEETPARRGRSPRGQGRERSSGSTPPPSQSTSAERSATCSVAGSTPCRSACTILITPATPAAACVCPRFDLTEPSHSGRRRPAAVP